MASAAGSSDDDSDVNDGENRRTAPQPGRPSIYVSQEEIVELLSMGFTKTRICQRLNISKSSLYKKMREFQLETSKFTCISDGVLDDTLKDIKHQHPNAGQVYLDGHLSRLGITVPRQRLRDSVSRIDPDGTEMRRRHTISRRVYSVPCPNFLWHVDGNHKLIRWRLVIHAGIDGFTRLVTYLHCSNNNCASTVHQLFINAIESYGTPIRLRSDYGGENTDVWAEMYTKRGHHSQPVICGSSVHNERVERLNRELNTHCTCIYKDLFCSMEAQGILDADNNTDLFCLHYVFLARINKTLHEFAIAHNNHRISTENNYTPLQLFHENQHLIPLHEDAAIADPYQGRDAHTLHHQEQPHIMVPVTDMPISQRQYEQLQRDISPFHEDDGVAVYLHVGRFVANCLLE